MNRRLRSFGFGALCFITASMMSPLAQAVRVVPPSDRSAQVVLFPLYQASAERSTLLAIANDDRLPKAVLVRLRESQNARAVVEFNLYLAPHDSWTAAIVLAPDGVSAALVVDDASCTVPAIKHSATLNGVRVIPNFAYALGNDDAGDNGPERARNGFIEIIEMGAIDPAFVLAPNIREPSATTCASVANAFLTQGIWALDPGQGMLPPRGGVSGFATLLDVRNGTSWAIPPTALAEFRSAHAHAVPFDGPTLSDTRGHDPAWVDAWVAVDGVPTKFQYPVDRAIDAISAVLMTPALDAAYSVDPLIDGRAEVVLTFPTKWVYVDRRPPAQVVPGPFPVTFAQGRAPTVYSATLFDGNRRDDQRSCEHSVDNRFACAEVQFLLPPDQPATRITGSQLTLAIGPINGLPSGLPPGVVLRDRAETPNDGRLRLHLGRRADVPDTEIIHALLPDRDGRVLTGQPVIGLMLQSASNSAARPGILASFGIARAMLPVGN